MDGFRLNELPDPRCAISTDHPIEVLRFAAHAMQCGRRCALVTLVNVIGGASRAPGAHMAVTDEGEYCGYVSGGCVEGIVAREALMALAAGRDRELRLGKGSSYFDVVLPCGGGIVLTIHVIDQIEPIQVVLEASKMREPAEMTYDPQSGRLTATTCPKETGWHSGHFSTVYRPDPRVLLFGRGLESDVLSKVTALLNIETVKEPEDVNPDKNTAYVVLYHDLEKELPVLRKALVSDAFYIGCLGSRKTHDLRCAALIKDGFTSQQIERICAPIGLFGPVRDARSLAVSIMAEVMSRTLPSSKG